MKQERTMEEMHHMPRTEEEKKHLLTRLHRCEGQIRGIEKMIEEDGYCPDILVQVSAVTAALNSFNKELLTCHLKSCVAEDMKAGREESIEELAKLMQKLMK
jgi:DNA-binding FrmR family transcriptional regulator